jgi:hypothetical protein
LEVELIEKNREFIMKPTKSIMAVFAAVTFAASLASCGKDDVVPELTPQEDRISTTLKGEMTLSLAGEGEVTIDWGDGEKDEITLTPLPGSGKPGAEHRFSHEYEDDDRKNISFTVDGEITAIATGKSGAMTVFRVNELAETLEYLDCSGEKLETLSVSDFRKLRYLDCSANAITRLSVGDCRELEELDCGANALTLDAAKAIFRALPDRDGEDQGKMRIAAPPAGLIRSDAQVAVDKNWEVTPELPLVYIPPTDPNDPDNPDDPDNPKTVNVGTQNGRLAAGVTGTVTFAVTTTNIAAGTYTATVANLPTGVTVGNGGKVTTGADGKGTLTLAGSTSTVSGTTSTLALTIDGVKSATFTLTVDVVWAESNVAAQGTFGANPQSYGNYYTFAEATTACPDGWRLPTLTEFQSLGTGVWTTINGVSGRSFRDNTVFIPAAGRYRNDTEVFEQNLYGYYRTSSRDYVMIIHNGGVAWQIHSESAKYSVRCVR